MSVIKQKDSIERGDGSCGVTSHHSGRLREREIERPERKGGGRLYVKV